MSKVTTALVSFALGVATTFLALSGSHTSTLAQALPSQGPPPQAPKPLPTLVGGGGMPTVPPISQHFRDFAVMGMPGVAFGIDGVDCVRCVLNGPVLRYGGGNFQFADFQISGPVRVEFVGAARNTLIFLNFVNGLAAGQAPKQNPTNPINKDPILKTAVVKETVTGSIGTE
jgi:hypothetical protein